MTVPGPPGGLWAVSLVVWAAGAVVVGEAVRGVAARWIPLWRATEPLERILLDFYLGGAAVFLLAAVELGAFVAPVVYGLPIAAGIVLVFRTFRQRRRSSTAPPPAAVSALLTDRWAWLAIASAVGLYVVELAVAVPVPTGNTYDSSLLTTYVAVLLQRGGLPLSFQPYGASALLYPQGTTVWLGWAQLDFGLPPARTSLLVTPLFLALAPLSGYVVGRRWLGTPTAGAAFALSLAWLGPASRSLVGGSNDFVFALPLVLLLLAQSTVWARGALPSVGDAVGFGLLVGYAGALNIVGTEWLLPALVGLGGLGAIRFGGRAWDWLARWGAAVASALVAGIPSIAVLVGSRGPASAWSGTLSAPVGVDVGISVAQFLGSIDPFLFRPGDTELSPIPFIRLELAVLLVAGAGVLWWVLTERSEASRWGGLARVLFASGLAIVAWLALVVASGVPGSPVRVVAFITNAQELSIALFTLYGLLAAVPLALALDLLRTFQAGAPGASPPSRGPGGRPVLPRLVPVLFAVVVLVPAVVLTPTSLSPVLSDYYEDFGHLSGADFDLLAYAGGHFPAGTRVLVAPGGAGEFLPGYARGIVLLYPMAPGWSRVNTSYREVVQELTNGTFDAAGRQALADLDVDRIVVTGNNTILWPAFWASPLLDAEVNSTPTFPVVWHEQDAWIFNATACRTGSLGCA